MATSRDNPAPRRRTWRRFVQFRIRTLLLVTFAVALGMFFYTRPEVIEEQLPLSGFRVKRQVYRTDENTPINHGWWELRDADGRLVCEGRYRNDQPNGHWVWRHPSGRVRQEGEYRRGLRHGTWKTWYDDGQPRDEWTYADGVLEGPARSWWPGSHVGESLRDSHSRLGETRPRAVTGHLASEGAYSAGQPSGPWTFYGEQGQRIAEGSYENGRREGPWCVWVAEGNEQPTEHYAAGRLVPHDEGLISQWRTRLNGHGFAKRSEAAWALGRLGEPGRTVLDEAAGSSDAEISTLAFLELVEQPAWAEANVPRLVAALDEPAEQVQLAAMLALSPLGSRAADAVPKLERLLGPEDDNEQSDPKVAVDNFGVCLLATLVSLAPERDDLVARLVRVYPKHAFYQEAYDEVARYLSRSAQPGLLKAVKAGKADVRAAAVATLGSAVRAERFPPSAAMMQVFVEALSDGDPLVRREACNAIALFGPAAGDLKPHLQKATSDPDPNVAQAAQNAIQMLDGGGGVFGSTGSSGGFSAFGGAGFF